MSIYYIGGADTLPQPLGRERESILLREMEEGMASADGDDLMRLSNDYARLTDDELRNETAELRTRYEAGETLDRLMERIRELLAAPDLGMGFHRMLTEGRT